MQITKKLFLILLISYPINLLTMQDSHKLGLELIKELNDNFKYLKDGKLNENLTKIKELIKEGANLNLKIKTYEPPLYTACSIGRLDIVKLLINNGADINIAYLDKHTPLTTAIYNCDNKYENYQTRIELVQFLIDSGVDLNNNQVCWAPLSIALINPYIYTGLVSMLIKGGAKVNMKTDSNQSPLYYAVLNNNIEITKYLIKERANITFKFDKETVLELAIKKNYYEIINLLKEEFDKLNLFKYELFKAINANDYDYVKELSKKGSFGIYDINGNNPLHLAIMAIPNNIRNYNKIIDLILNIRPQLADEKNNNGLTPISLVIKEGKFFWINYLLKKEISKN